MDGKLARATLQELEAYTKDVLRLLGVQTDRRRVNHSGRFGPGQPSGIICHYTGSNRARSGKRPYGRLPQLLDRLRPYGSAPVGAQVVVWDEPEPRFDELKSRYPLIREVPAEVFFFGDELALWHAGAANGWSLGIEVRNAGELELDSLGQLFWNRGRNRYRGRPPVEVKGRLWEPFTWNQMVGVLWVSRLLAQVHPILPRRFLGHVHVSSTRVDPGPHFPLEEMRAAVFETPELPLLDVPFLRDCRLPDLYPAQDEELVPEVILDQGLFRDGRDGVAEEERGEEGRVADELLALRGRGDVISEVKRRLRSFGYYPGADDGPEADEDFIDTVRLFQGRWKVRDKRSALRRWRGELKVTGKLDQQTLVKLEAFESVVSRYI